MSTRVRQRTQAGMKEQVTGVAETSNQVYTSILFLCFFFPSFFGALLIRKKPTTINFDFFQVPLALSPVTGRRLDYTIFSVDISV